MTFDYSIYYRCNCIVPLGFAVFTLCILGGALAFFAKHKITVHSKEMLAFLFVSGICAFLLVINIIRLSRGGILLLFEKEADQVQVSGVIDEIIEIGFLTGARYDIEANNGNGEAIVVNGEKFYLTTCGEFDVGDYVVLNVLPRSGFVLSISKQ